MSQLLRNNTIPAEIMQLVPRYLAGSLSRADAESFEEYCILHPEVAAEVANERLLREGVVALHQEPVAAGSEPASTRTGPARSERARAQPHWGRWLAVAATLAAVLIGIRIARESRLAAGPLLASVGSSAGASASVRMPQLTLLTLRGRSPVLEVSSSDRVASIELQPDPAAPGMAYQLSLEELDASERWLPLGSLQAVADRKSGNISFGLALTNLHEGRLRLLARPQSSSAPSVSAEFLLRRNAGAER